MVHQTGVLYLCKSVTPYRCVTLGQAYYTGQVYDIGVGVLHLDRCVTLGQVCYNRHLCYTLTGVLPIPSVLLWGRSITLGHMSFMGAVVLH